MDAKLLVGDLLIGCLTHTIWRDRGGKNSTKPDTSVEDMTVEVEADKG